jgi:flagellar biosynthesis protein FliR
MDDILTHLFQLPDAFFSHYDLVWTWSLLIVRYSALFLLLPGLNSGMAGLAIRLPSMIVFALVATYASPRASLPEDIGLMSAALCAELLLGSILGILPSLIVAAAHAAGSLASSLIGLNAGSFFDPSLGIQSTELSKFLGDLTIILFFAMDCHHVVMYTASGATSRLVPGTFLLQVETIDGLVYHSAAVLHHGILLAAPVLGILFLVQVLMGVLSKAVPTVNVFIVSFPITAGIGLVVFSLSLPAAARFLSLQLGQLPREYLAIMGAP